MVSCMTEVAKLLGVEEGEVFQIDGDITIRNCIFKFENGFLQVAREEGSDGTWLIADDSRLTGLIYGKLSIHKLSWKPKMGESYYLPHIDTIHRYHTAHWLNNAVDQLRYRRGLVCRTKEEAITLTKMAEEMIASTRN